MNPNFFKFRHISFHLSQLKYILDLISADCNFLENVDNIGNQINEKLIEDNGKLLICGNGGSAADSQHFAAEIVGRYKTEKYGMPAIALTTDTSVITAIANDYGYEHVFERQVQALMDPDTDIVFGISTSGKSKNILKAFECANSANGMTIALTGASNDNPMKELANYCIEIPCSDTPIIQACHISIIHILCEMFDSAYSKKYGVINNVFDN